MKHMARVGEMQLPEVWFTLLKEFQNFKLVTNPLKLRVAKKIWIADFSLKIMKESSNNGLEWTHSYLI